MLGFALDVVFFLFIVRSIWKLLQGFKEGYSGSPKASNGGVPSRGVQMARDPVCGTYVVPGRALAISDGSRRIYFCSPACRDKYQAKSA